MAHADATSEEQDGANASKGVLRELAAIAIAAVIGVGGAALLHHRAGLRAIGLPESIARADDIARYLDAGAGVPPGSPLAGVIGNSAAVEGIDASDMAAATSGWNIINCAANGTNQIEARLYAGRLLGAGADLVVWIYRPDMMGDPRTIHPDVIYGFARGRYAAKADWLGEPWVSQQDLETFNASPLDVSMHFRRRPVAVMNETLRQKLRPGIRSTPSMAFDAVNNMDVGISGAKLDRHVGEIDQILEESQPGLDADGPASGRALVRGMAEDCMQSGARLVVVIAPSHPDLATRVAPMERRVETVLGPLLEPFGGVVLNAGGMLTADEFADAIHPNAEGRAKFSGWIGQRLPPATDSNTRTSTSAG